MKSSVIAACAILLTTCAVAQAQPVKLNSFGAWGVYSYKNDGRDTCYILSIPTTMKPDHVDHGDNFFLVAPPPRSSSGYVPQAIMGYDLEPGSTLTATVGDKAFTLAPQGRAAWTRREVRDAELVAAMKAGATMTLNARSRRGTETIYSFSLKGMTAALKGAARCAR
ncbi:invasion associated locus B family protein [Ensifer canadensis]